MPTDPAWLSAARRELGVHETPGPVSTQRVLDYRKMANLNLGGDDGVVPWCAIFVNAMLRSTRVVGSGSAMARSFLRWGTKLAEPAVGAIVVLESAVRPPPAGHVAFATGRWTPTHVEVIGGNQGDRVSIALFERRHVLGYRWPLGLPMPAARAVLIPAGAPAGPVSDI